MSKLEDHFALQLRARRIDGWEREHLFARPRRWRFDFAWPEFKLAVEIDGGTWSGGRHTRGAGFAKDCEKMNAAQLAGWVVFRGDSGMVRDCSLVETVERALEQRRTA